MIIAYPIGLQHRFNCILAGHCIPIPLLPARLPIPLSHCPPDFLSYWAAAHLPVPLGRCLPDLLFHWTTAHPFLLAGHCLSAHVLADYCPPDFLFHATHLVAGCCLPDYLSHFAAAMLGKVCLYLSHWAAAHLSRLIYCSLAGYGLHLSMAHPPIV